MKLLVLKVARVALIILFTYASVVKLVEIGVFQKQLAQSPLIENSLIKPLSFGLPLFELFITFLLTSDKYLQKGAFLSFLLMLFFTIYLLGLYNLYDHVPCACGGILGKMSYPVHIVFNAIFTLLCLYLYVQVDHLVKTDPPKNDH